MPIKPVLTTLIAFFILALYAIPLPSSLSSIATTIITNSQLGALTIHSTFFGYRHHHHHHHHHHEPIKRCEKWTSRLTHQYKTSLVLIVDLHGCRNLSNVQSAIDAVPDLSPSKTLIIVNSGSYREKVTVNENKTNIVLQGRGYQNTSIEWNDTAKSAGIRYESSFFLRDSSCGSVCHYSTEARAIRSARDTSISNSIPGSPVDLTKCWSSLFKIQGCNIEILKSALTGKFENVGPTCCKAFIEVDAKCWPKMFPLNPLFPPLLKDVCSRISAAAPDTTIPIPGSPIDLTKCLSSLVNVEGCVTEIYKSVFTRKFGNVGPILCCKAFSDVDAKCWPQIFPLNPFFPPLLKNECSRINGAAPTHK